MSTTGATAAGSEDAALAAYLERSLTGIQLESERIR